MDYGRTYKAVKEPIKGFFSYGQRMEYVFLVIISLYIIYELKKLHDINDSKEEFQCLK